MGYVLWLLSAKVARRHSACFENLKKGGAQLRQLVSHFRPRLCYSAPITPLLALMQAQDLAQEQVVLLHQDFGC